MGLAPPPAPPALLPSPVPVCGRQDRKGSLCFAEVDQQAEETDQGQQAQTPVTTSPSASSTTSFMSSSLEDTTTATTPVTDTETVPASESPGVLPLSLLRYLLVSMPHCFAEFGLSAAGRPALCLSPLSCLPEGKCSPATPPQLSFPRDGHRRPPSPPCRLLPRTMWAGASHSPPPILSPPDLPIAQVGLVHSCLACLKPVSTFVFGKPRH